MNNSVNVFDISLPATVQWVEPTTTIIANQLLDECALPPGARVLDVGTGTGPLAEAAAQRGYRVNAIDTAPILTTYVTGRLAPFPGSTAELMDVTAMTYPDDAFDAAFSVFTVMYLRDAVPAALAELRRVVRPGGTVAIVHWAQSSMSPIMRVLFESAEPPLDVPVDYVDAHELAAAVTRAGFLDVRVKPSTAEYLFPAADDVFWEFSSFYVKLPPFRSLTAAQRATLETAMIDRTRRIETGRVPRPELVFNVAYARVPE
ncbi:class I SAM-dependent methyltransferase [Streptomyces mirabilis]